MKSQSFKKSKKTGKWGKAPYNAGLCFTLSWDRFEKYLHAAKALKVDEEIEHVEIDRNGITVYIDKNCTME